MSRFRNKYRVESTRLKGYDYSRNGDYFVTICTKNRIHLFGDIVPEIPVVEAGLRPASTTIPSPKLILSDAGKIVSDCWYDLPNHYSNIILDEFIIMPDHIHGIIQIHNRTYGKNRHGLSEFVRAFKSFSSRRINELYGTADSRIWQPRFYDHVIFSKREKERIRQYIKNNPRRWLEDSGRQ